MATMGRASFPPEASSISPPNPTQDDPPCLIASAAASPTSSTLFLTSAPLDPSISSLTIFSTSSASTNPLTDPPLGITLSPTPHSSASTNLAFRCCSAMKGSAKIGTLAHTLSITEFHPQNFTPDRSNPSAISFNCSADISAWLIERRLEVVSRELQPGEVGESKRLVQRRSLCVGPITFENAVHRRSETAHSEEKVPRNSELRRALLSPSEKSIRNYAPHGVQTFQSLLEVGLHEGRDIHELEEGGDGREVVGVLHSGRDAVYGLLREGELNNRRRFDVVVFEE
nr:hypothetical protein Iba_chr03aCG10390 [Ipomoea batatas]